MAKRTVVWTATAARQRLEVLKYWVERNGNTKYAEKLIMEIKGKIKLILKNPPLFKKIEFPDTYNAVMGHYSIFYKVTKDTLVVTAFWDNRQDPQKLYKLLS